MHTQNTLLREANHYVADLFTDQLPSFYTYHNYQHTQDTVLACIHLANSYNNISEKELERLLLAAWFRNTGYISGPIEVSAKSKEIASNFLLQKHYDESDLNIVLNYIDSSQNDQVPADLLSQVLADATRIDIGKETYSSKSALLRIELTKSKKQIYSDSEWIISQLDFLRANGFYTDIAKENYEPQRQKNIKDLEKKLEKIEKKKNKNYQKDDHKMDARWGIQTLFRSVYRSHINLSSIADGKANIMIRVNSMIISITLTLVGAKFSFLGTSFSESQIIILPIITLLFTGLVTIIFAILSAKPSITHIIHQPDDIPNKDASLLFFGNFSTISIKDYKSGMKNLILNKDDIYESMMTDLYFLGKVLTKKYKLIKISYMVFMTGLILTASITIYVVLSLKHLI